MASKSSTAELPSETNFTEKRKLVAELEKEHGAPQHGQKWFAVWSQWWTGFDAGESLGDLNNKEIYDPDVEGLKQGLEEEFHYVLKPEPVWRKLQQWFNATPEISADVVLNSHGKPKIDLYPARFKITSGKSKKIIAFSRQEKIINLKKLIAQKLKKDPKYLKIKLKPSSAGSSEYAALSDLIPSPEVEGENAKPSESTLSDCLPEIGLKLWDLRVKDTTPPAHQRRMSVEQKYDPKNPKLGQRIDVKKGTEWFEAVIDEINPSVETKKPKAESVDESKSNASSEKSKDESKEAPEPLVTPETETTKIKVHFLSFEASEDKILPADSEDISSAYSKVADWRTQLRVREKVEINKRMIPGTTSGADWLEGEITKISRSASADDATLQQKYLKQIASCKLDAEKSPKLLSKLKTAFTRFRPGSVSKSPVSDRHSARSDLSGVSSVESAIMISEHGLVMVKVVTGGAAYWNKVVKEVVVDLGSEWIAAESTHIKKKAKVMYSWHKNEEALPSAHGVVGLRNIGNTCYLNSTMQCLLATLPLTEYFLSGAYKKDLNRKNPLGFGGKIASAYGKVLEEYFSDKFKVVTPTNFKAAIGNAFENFQGMTQQDAHEFCSLLLDALHEDLNLVKNKPFIEAPEDEGKSDSVLANLFWEGYLKRNQSVIVDTMTGQFKSHLLCPNCNKEATAFDPFSTWMVPIPVNEVKYVRILFVSLHPRKVKVENKTHTLLSDDADTTVTDAKVSFKETRFFRSIYEAKDSILVGKDLAADLSVKYGVAVDDILIYDLKYNKPKDVLFESTEHSHLHTAVSNETEFIAYEVEPLEETPKSIEAKVVSPRVGLNETLAGDRLKGGFDESQSPNLIAESPTETQIQPSTDVDSESIGSDDDMELIMKLQYKPSDRTTYKVQRAADLLRFYERETTIKDIHEMIWKRSKFMFRTSGVLTESGYSVSNKTVTPEEIDLSTKLYTVKYLGETLDPTATHNFAITEGRHNNDTIDVMLTPKGLSLLSPGIQPEAPFVMMYGVGDMVEKANQGVNVGFIYLDDSVYNNSKEENEKLDLYQCFEAFRKKEKLGEEDQWYCSTCKEHVRATKKMDVYRTGDVLVITLKRFKGERYRREKMNFLIDFPVNGLDLNKIVLSPDQDNKLFDLYGVSYHMGTMFAGHYTAKVKVDGEWYDMNDSTVRKISNGKYGDELEKNIVNSSAYVLFYKVRTKEEAARMEANESEGSSEGSVDSI